MVEIIGNPTPPQKKYEGGTETSPGDYSEGLTREEIGLSPGQTRGSVRGEVIERPRESDISKPFIVPVQPKPEQQNFNRFNRLTEDEAVRLGRQPINEPAYGSQLYYKERQLESQTAQWASEQEFQEKARIVGQATPGTNEYRGTVINAGPSRPEQRPRIIPNAPPQIIRERPQVIYDPKYGTMIRQDLIKRPEESIGQQMTSSNVTVSKTSQDIMTGGQGISNEWRRVASESPVQFPGAGLIRESSARLIEFGSAIPATSEIIVKTAVKNPVLFGKAAVVGTVAYGESMAAEATSNPLQLASDIVVSSVVFGGITKGSKAVVGTGRGVVGNVKVGTKEMIADTSAEVLRKRKPAQKLELIQKPKEPEVVQESKNVIFTIGRIKKQAKSADVVKSMEEQARWRPAYETIEEAKASEKTVQMSESYKPQTPEQIAKTRAKMERLANVNLKQEYEQVYVTRSDTLPIIIATAKTTPQEKAIAKTIQVSPQVEKAELESVAETIQQSKSLAVTINKAATAQKEKEDELSVSVPELSTDSGLISAEISTPDFKTPSIESPGIKGIKKAKPERLRTPIDSRTEEGRSPGPHKIPKPKPIDSPTLKSPFKPKKKASKDKKEKDTGIEPWYPASLESVTKEEFELGGKRAIHIKSKEITQKEFQGLKVGGRPIRTKRQYSKSGGKKK